MSAIYTANRLIDESASLVVVVSVKFRSVPELCEVSCDTTADYGEVELLCEVSTRHLL